MDSGSGALVRKDNGVSIGLRQILQLLRSDGSRNRERRMRSEQRWFGWRSCIQYIGFPIIRDRGLGGQAFMSHGGVADEHDIVLSPSDRGQQISEITITGDKDHCGWGRIVVDKPHDIH